MLILGINHGRNPSLVVMQDGKPIFALEEERVARIKEVAGFPGLALAFMLQALGLRPADFAAVALTGDQAAAFAELDQTGFAKVPRFRYRRHDAHAASAYWGRRFDPDSPHLVLSLDEGGDGACAQVAIGQSGRIRSVARTPTGHAPNAIFAAVTAQLGMTPGRDDYKVMGLAPYADPEAVAAPLSRLRAMLGLDPSDPRRFKRNVRERCEHIGARLDRELGRIRFDHLAGAAQTFMEDAVADWVAACVAACGIGKVVASGEAFRNVKVNRRILTLPGIESFDVFPSCGTESLAFGAAWTATMQLAPDTVPVFDSLFLGPDATDDFEAARTRFQGRFRFERMKDAPGRIAALLAGGQVVARCAGAMEFGARALGNRSLLADPTNPWVVRRLNRAIKQRDFWMPFAPAALAERAQDYVTLPATLPKPSLSPFMMHGFDTTTRRDEFAAALHPYDDTARLQTVREKDNPGFHAILARFAALTGRAILLNTSFNRHGFPIVMGSTDALAVMEQTELTHLVLGDWLVTKP